MPNLDGVTLVRKIRSELGLNELKIVLLTLKAEIEFGMSENLSIVAYVTKPVKQAKLYEKLLEIIAEKKICNEENSLNAVDAEAEFVEKHILLVEDNEDNQKLADRILQKAGFRVTIADNGLAAFEYYKENHYDLILMDIQMPVMNGFEATRAIREYEQKSNRGRTPIVAVTAHAMKGYDEECRNNGMDDYTTKPIRKKTLLCMVNRWLASNISIVDNPVKAVSLKST
jgi:CheY-like chemotaxis protein